MFRFENLSFLWLLILLLIIAIGIRYVLKKSEVPSDKWGSRQILQKLSVGLGDNNFEYLRYILWMGVFAFAILGLANPQWGYKQENLKTNAADVYIALDISRSMDVNDISPSRLIRAKKYAIGLIEALKGNNLAIVFFAGTAYMQIPLTSDYAAAIMMINAVSTDLAGSQGTNINAVSKLVLKAKEKQPNATANLILITDGEDHEGDAIDAIKSLNDEGVTTYCIGAGTKEGGFIIEGGGYKMDDNGKPVVSKLNIGLINDMAKAGSGRAFGLEDEASIDAILSDISQSAKSEKTTRSFNQYQSFFQLFLTVALMLLIAEYILDKWYYLRKKIN